MAVGPFGPWSDRPRSVVAEEGEAAFLGPDEVEDGPPHTDTILDEFLPVYYWLARPTKKRQGFTQPEIDGMDMTVVAMLLGVADDRSRFEDESAAILAARMEAHAAGAAEPTWEDLAVKG